MGLLYQFIFGSLYLFFSYFYCSEACTNQTTINCATFYPNSRIIYVWGKQPLGNCTLVTIDSINYIFDPIMINYVWITLTNTDNACIQNITTRAAGISTILGTPTQEIVLLNVTALYYRIVMVPKGCTTTCAVVPFTAAFESQLSSAVKLSNGIQLYPIFNNLNQYGIFCLNNGVLDSTYTGAGYRCSCTTYQYFTGPRCEYMETNLTNNITYFNVFRSATTINLRFSIFSNGITGSMNIISIKNSVYQPVLRLIVNESSVVMVAESTVAIPGVTRIDNQVWYDIYIVLTRQNVTITINSNSYTMNLANQVTADFRSYYLVIYESTNSASNVSLKNFILSGKVLDFNNPLYQSGCANRCSSCTSTQICNCRPFVSLLPTIGCSCKPSYLQSSVTCVPNNIPLAQITSGIIANFPISNVPLTTVDFSFQTLSVNGTLLTVTLANPSPTLAIQIVNTNLTLSVSTLSTSTLNINYNVSNGQLHNVTLNVKPYSLEMIIDNNYNYTRNVLNWYSAGASSITVSSLSIGPMQLPFISTINNLTTCFSVIRLNAVSAPLDTYPSLSPQFTSPCTSGPSCTSGALICPSNQMCISSEWQNTKCICIANFTSVNSTCTYNQCIPNPCLNAGQCAYNNATGNYSCVCASGFSGSNCGTATATAQFWWIAVVVVGILLIIVFIALLVYCCFYRNRNPDTVPFIVKINENIVVYNEQAGECDYTGPPIDFGLMKNVLKTNGLPMTNGLTKDIPNWMNKKEEFDQNNTDLILDHPLEYGYEGNDSDNASLSSIGSKSAGSQQDDQDPHNLNNINQIIT